MFIVYMFIVRGVNFEIDVVVVDKLIIEECVVKVEVDGWWMNE